MVWWFFGRRRRKDKKTRSLEIPRGEEPPILKTLSLPPGLQNPFDDKFETPRTPPPNPALQNIAHSSAPTSPPQSHPARRNTKKASAEDITALPKSSDIRRSPHLRPVPEQDIPSSPPTRSKSKRGATDQGLLRRKSSKRRKDDYDRELEVKSMSMPIPIPKKNGSEPMSFYGSVGRKGRPFGNNFEGPVSNVSLHTARSARSSMTGFSDQRFEVGSVDIFSPRPTIRQTVVSPNPAAPARSAGPSRADSKKTAISQASRRSSEDRARIDNLADDYDARALRELLERDKRRRERRRKAEEERARRKLEKLAAKRGDVDASKAPKSPTDRPRSRRKNKTERPLESYVGEGGGNPGSSKKGAIVAGKAEVPQLAQTPPVPQKSPDREAALAVASVEDELKPMAFEDITESLESSNLPAPHSRRRGTHDSQGSISPPSSPFHHTRVPSNLSASLHSPSVQDVSEGTESDRRASVTSTRRGGIMASLFRRSGTGKGRADNARYAPSEASFSNTSRESMARQMPPAHLRERASMPQTRSASGTPVRTKSKFREDLPELPISPPDSRLQSPELPENEAVQSGFRSEPQSATSMRAAKRPIDLSLSRNASSRSFVPSATLLSQSLASVDSEGSWLSGRPSKRVSQSAHPGDSIAERHASYEDLGMSDEEYFRRMTPAPEPMGARQRGAIGAALAGSAGPQAREEERMISGDVARKPTVVHRQQRVQSNEGLLNQFQADAPEHDVFDDQEAVEEDEDDEDDDDASEASSADAESANEEESRTFSYGHARQISSGSARMLDIPARGSSTRVPPTESEASESEGRRERRASSS